MKKTRGVYFSTRKTTHEYCVLGCQNIEKEVSQTMLFLVFRELVDILNNFWHISFSGTAQS